MKIRCIDVDAVWQVILDEIVAHGTKESPRSLPTREVINVNLEVMNLRANVLHAPYRGLNYRFMVAEWAWIQAGLNLLHPLAKYNSKMLQFSDDLHTLSGAYGPSVASQLPYVLRKLKEDDTSRQAVINIWRPNPAPSKDIPCTISLQFLKREDGLHVIANMRSSDAWLGLPYDMFVFSQLANEVAGRLGWHTGRLMMNLGSCHLYEKNLEQARTQLSNVPLFSIRSPALLGPVHPCMALEILTPINDPYISTDPWPPMWKAYVEVLRCTSSLSARLKLKELEKAYDRA